VIAELVPNEEIAAAHEVTLRTVQGWVARRGGKPFESVEESLAWVSENIGRNGITLGDRKAGRFKTPKNELDEEEQRARIRKLDAEAAAKELKNAVMRGELYDAAEAELNVSEFAGMIRGELESWPDVEQTEWPADVRELVTERLRTRIELLLRRMSQWRLGK